MAYKDESEELLMFGPVKAKAIIYVILNNTDENDMKVNGIKVKIFEKIK
jgi:hypothetical protein